MKRVLNEGKLLLVNNDFSPYFYWVDPYSLFGIRIRIQKAAEYGSTTLV